LDGDGQNYTVIVRDLYSQNLRQGAGGYGFSGYELRVASALMSNGTLSGGTFRPNPDMYRADADIYLFFLSGNGVLATQPTVDPWYRFNVRSNETHNGVGGVNPGGYYSSTEAASPLGCAMQHQFCKGPDETETSCGPLSSYDDAVRGALPIFNINIEAGRSWMDGLAEIYSTDMDASRFLWLLSIFQHYSPGLDSAVVTLGSQSLADFTGLSMLQASLVDTANGARDPNIASLYQNATNNGQKSICQNQKILGNSYTSISVFGLLFTYILGSLVILIFLTLEPIISRGHKGLEKAYQWKTNELLHLQGLAFEARSKGQGDWERCLKSVPIPKDKEQVFPPLEWADLEQPRYRLSQDSVLEQPETTTPAAPTTDTANTNYATEDRDQIPREPPRLPVETPENDSIPAHHGTPLMSDYLQTDSNHQYLANISDDAFQRNNLRFSTQIHAFVPPARPLEPSPRTRERRG
ncbi:hypothetical protein F5Y08DRAFT_353243, partial [Xylaria arbuscula]